MVSFTLDTNCIIDVAEGRPGAAAIRDLADAHAAGEADVALVAVSASERQQGDKYLENFSDFQERLTALSLNHLTVLPSIGYWNIGFYGLGIWPDEQMVERERSIHESLFPSIPFAWPDFAAQIGIAPDTIKIAEAKRWRNAFCDRQMFWSHDHNKRDIFVTSDVNFRKKLTQSDNFKNARILTPDEARCFVLI
jgi:hypothetical protein